MMIEQDFKTHWRYMGEKVRQAYLEELSRIPVPDLSSYFEKADCSFTVDFSNTRYCYGDKCVYAYVTNRCELFYIGTGSNWRAIDRFARSENFKDKIRNNSCRIFILAAFMDEGTADEVETFCIRLAQIKGHRLLNKRKIINDEEISSIKNGVSPVWLNDMLYAYPKIKQMFDCFNSSLLDDVLSDNSQLRAGVLIGGDLLEKERRQCWRIENCVKPATEWCKIFNTKYSLVIQRMNDQGLTLYEALTYPKIPSGTIYRGGNLTAWSVWKSYGLELGTDFRAEIIGRLRPDEIESLNFMNPAY